MNMFKKRKIKLERMLDSRDPEYHKAMMEMFDEEEDVILPLTLFGELVYIFYIVRDMIEDKTDLDKKKRLLYRQICMFWKWYIQSKKLD